jgi:hypothetical protein
LARGLILQPALGIGLAAILSSGLLGCAPRPSSVPLGLGPLALAEQSAAPGGEVEVPPARAAAAPAAAEKVEKEPEEPESSTEDDAEASAAEPSEDSETAASAPAAPANFPGLYAGKDVAIFRLPGMPEREEHDDKAKIRIEKASGENVRIVLVNTTDGSDLCTLVARVDGNAAVLEKAQPCFGSGGEGEVQAELHSGRAVLDGDTLTMDAEGPLFVSVGEQELAGDLSYSFEGARQ